MLDYFGIVKTFFESFGWQILERPDAGDNNPDMVLVGKRKCLNIEIKTVRLKSNGVYEADNISENQRKWDAVAIVFPNGRILVEDMAEYLSHCSQTGYRYFTWLNPEGSHR